VFGLTNVIEIRIMPTMWEMKRLANNNRNNAKICFLILLLMTNI